MEYVIFQSPMYHVKLLENLLKFLKETSEGVSFE